MSSQDVQKSMEEIDNYEQSVNACLSFIHIYKWDEERNLVDTAIRYNLGKKFSPGDVTPDVTIQLTEDRGLVTEFKVSLPKNEGVTDLWKEEFDQLKSYDVQLEGWDTLDGKVPNQELILMVGQKFSRKVVDYVTRNGLTFNNFSQNFAVVQYSPLDGIKNGVFLRLEHGDVNDFKKITNRRLKEGIPVAFEYLFKGGLSKIKFLDYKPPVVYLMSVLWDHVFNSMLTEEDWRNAIIEGDRKIIEIEVNSPEVTKILVENFSDPISGNSIKSKWIEEALEIFVSLGFAKKLKSPGSYIIRWRKKISDQEGSNKHLIFSQMLYESGVQSTLKKFGPKKKSKKK